MKEKIKKYLIIFFILLVPSFTNATSGACSYHGGVNCSVGPNKNGNVTCLDGFDSSVPYYQSTECLINKCKTEDDLARIRSINLNSGLIDSPVGQTKINQCEEEIQEYQNSQAYTYQQTNYKLSSSNAGLNNVCYKYHGYNSLYVESRDRCECAKGYAPNTLVPFTCQTLDSFCKENKNYGIFSHSITDTYIDGEFIEKTCSCDKGFWLINGKCESPLLYCVQKYGNNTHPVYDGAPLNCQCNDGYSFASSSNECKITTKSDLSKLENVFGQDDKKSITKPEINTKRLPDNEFQREDQLKEKVKNDLHKDTLTSTTTSTTSIIKNEKIQFKRESILNRLINFIKGLF